MTRSQAAGRIVAAGLALLALIVVARPVHPAIVVVAFLTAATVPLWAIRPTTAPRTRCTPSDATPPGAARTCPMPHPHPAGAHPASGLDRFRIYHPDRGPSGPWRSPARRSS